MNVIKWITIIPGLIELIIKLINAAKAKKEEGKTIAEIIEELIEELNTLEAKRQTSTVTKKIEAIKERLETYGVNAAKLAELRGR